MPGNIAAIIKSRGSIALIKSRRFALRAAGNRLPRNRRVPRALQPSGLEREYYTAILALVDPLFQEVRERLIPRLPEIVQRYQEETRVDSMHTDVDWAPTDVDNAWHGVDCTRINIDSTRADMVMGYAQLITRTISDIKIGIALQTPDIDIQLQTDTMARRVAAFNKQQVDRQFKSVLGINPVTTERWLEPQVASFVEGNVSLIKSIPEDYLKRVEQMVRASVERGVATNTLEQEIIDQFGTAKAKAHLIARDQISKFNGKLHELRQREAGVSKYIWSTSKDERVRPKHAAVDGETFSWDDPPPVGNNGERLHPGQDYQCRCVALPVLEEFL